VCAHKSLDRRTTADMFCGDFKQSEYGRVIQYFATDLAPARLRAGTTQLVKGVPYGSFLNYRLAWTYTTPLRARPAPQRGRQRRGRHCLRGSDPQVCRTLQRDCQRVLHAARGDPADGDPAVHRGRQGAAETRHRVHALRSRQRARARGCRWRTST
jgi:hypothetical protein